MRVLPPQLLVIAVLCGCGGAAATTTVTETVTVTAGAATADSPAAVDAPAYVTEVLAIVDETGAPPAGYVGGRRFENRERRLPRTASSGARIRYTEYDVHPEDAPGDRGPERLVVGDDGSAYYTSDHYESFRRIR